MYNFKEEAERTVGQVKRADSVENAAKLVEEKLRDAFRAGQDSMDRCALDL